MRYIWNQGLKIFPTIYYSILCAKVGKWPWPLPRGELFEVKVKCQGQGHILCASYCPKLWVKFEVPTMIRSEVMAKNVFFTFFRCHGNQFHSILTKIEEDRATGVSIHALNFQLIPIIPIWDMRADRQTNRQTNRQTDKQTDRPKNNTLAPLSGRG